MLHANVGYSIGKGRGEGELVRTIFLNALVSRVSNVTVIAEASTIATVGVTTTLNIATDTST